MLRKDLLGGKNGKNCGVLKRAGGERVQYGDRDEEKDVNNALGIEQ